MVWPRDLVQSAIGLLASGQVETPRAALIWLACLQGANGELPQNSWIHGEAYWTGMQLDEVAAPILLAWHLRKEKALGDFDPWTVIGRAARYLVLHGPVTRQERWEEASGYSPSTPATITAGLVIVAEFARERGDDDTAHFLLDYADWLSAHIEAWTVTTRGELVPHHPRHYVRITPVDAGDAYATAQPDTATIHIVNGGGDHPARNVVGGDFLSLVRLGLRDPHDPLIVNSLSVLDMWSFEHRLSRIAVGKTLRVIVARPTVIRWSESNGASGDVTANKSALGLWFADLPTKLLAAGTKVEFMWHSEDGQGYTPQNVAIE